MRRRIDVYAGAAATACLVALCFLRFGLSGRALVASAFVIVLVILSVVDIRERRLPNRIVLPSAAVLFAANVALSPERWLEWMLAAFGAALFLFVPLLVYPSGMGMGDVKLALLLGATLGRPVAGALVVALLASAVVGLALILAGGIGARKRSIPFGPFLAAGGVVALFAGERAALL